MVIQDIYASQKRLKNFRITIQVKRQEPTKGEVQFIHDHLTSFRSLKVFTGEYGFIVPIKVAWGRRVLKGEKKLKYNMVSTSLL